MPRKPRTHFNKAMYHVMLQGNFKHNIFFEEDDYLKMYELLEKATAQYNCKIHLFCLMTNHIHLVIQVIRVPLDKIMQSITPTYARYINKKMNQHGHLFRGRYRSILVQDERYLLELCYYIHNNPLKAQLVNNLDDYPWSSHHTYAKQHGCDWLTTSFIQNLLTRQVNGKLPYHDFMRDRENTFKEPKFCSFSEDGELIIFDTINIMVNTTETLNLTSLTLDEIIDTICVFQDVTLGAIRIGNNRDDITITRTLITFLAHHCGRYQIKDIAFVLGHSVDTISKTMHRQFRSRKKRPILDHKLHLLELKFKSVLLDKQRKLKISQYNL